MATIESNTGIVPASPMPPTPQHPQQANLSRPAPLIQPAQPIIPSFEQIQAGGLVIPVTEYAPSGLTRQFNIPVDFAGMAQPDGSWKSVLTRAAFLKLGPMSSDPFGSIVSAVLYADRLGLDIFAKDCYVVDGKLAVSAEGKIKFADQSGLVEWRRIKVDAKGERVFTYSSKQGEQKVTLPNFHAVVTVKMKSDPDPQVMEWDLADFFGGSSAWRTDTKSMFSKRALGKTLGILVPTGVDAEEIPTASEVVQGVTSPTSTPTVGELRAAVNAEKEKTMRGSSPASVKDDAPLVTVSPV